MPFLEVHEDGYIELHEQLPTLVTATLLGLLRSYWVESRLYGENGEVWCTVPAPGAVPRPSMILRLLANTVYNPTRRVPVTHERFGEFNLEHLKRRIAGFVARDDDVLTQFMEASEINEQLERARTFGDVVALVRRMRGEYPEVAQQGDGADERRPG